MASERVLLKLGGPLLSTLDRDRDPVFFAKNTFRAKRWVEPVACDGDLTLNRTNLSHALKLAQASRVRETDFLRQQVVGLTCIILHGGKNFLVESIKVLQGQHPANTHPRDSRIHRRNMRKLLPKWDAFDPSSCQLAPINGAGPA